MGLTSGIGHGSFQVRLPPRPASVAEARSRMRRLLREAGREDLVEVAMLLVSEVVTNALLHAGTDIDLTAVLGVDGLRVEVGDGSPHLPSRRRYAATAGTGRGLMMLETMVDDWGVTRRPVGKIVWFRISGPGLPLEDPVELRGEHPGRSDGRRDHVTVELRNMPLLLHAAWQEHAEALLREFLLASLDDVGAPNPIRTHADATDAIAVLEEHLPRVAVSMVTDALMVDATEPHVSVPVVRVPVPRDSVAHFGTLDRAIEAALALSRDGLVLTPPTQPEVQAFRTWVCGQVLGQAAGASPEPWRVPDEALDAVDLPAGWDPVDVSDAEHGLIAADESSRILAVSEEAATLLGYDDPAELIGKRIVSIVPERYRQAHVAGFTMYLLVGRKPLLDRQVRIAALRRDGTEIEVDLTVRSPAPGADRSVLMADLRPVVR